MKKSFRSLQAKMSPEAQARAKAKANMLLTEMHLAELRQARKLSQEQIAERLHVKQASISKMERRTDMYISTLREFIHAAGGELEITARFPDGDIKINQFEDLEKTPTTA